MALHRWTVSQDGPNLRSTYVKPISFLAFPGIVGRNPDIHIPFRTGLRSQWHPSPPESPTSLKAPFNCEIVRPDHSASLRGCPFWRTGQFLRHHLTEQTPPSPPAITTNAENEKCKPQGTPALVSAFPPGLPALYAATSPASHPETTEPSATPSYE